MAPSLGVQLFTVRRYTQSPDDLKKALERIRGIGYTSVETAGFGDMTAAQVAAICREQDITIGSTHTPWDRFKFDLDAVIEEHKTWDCSLAGVGMIAPKVYNSEAGLEQFLTELAPIAAKLKENGIGFIHHNHNHEFQHFDGKPWLAHLYDRTTNAEVQAEFDTHWIVAGGGDPVRWIERYGDRIAALHLKDFAMNAENQRVFAPVGSGNMNWKGIFATASRHDIRHYFVEQDNCYGRDEFECLEESYRFLANLGIA